MAAISQLGDLIGSGTVSGPEKSSWGSLLELSARGSEPIALPGGETRSFIEDGDEIIFRGFCGKARLSAHRLRRMPRRRRAGGMTAHSDGTHFCSRFPVSTSPV